MHAAQQRGRLILAAVIAVVFWAAPAAAQVMKRDGFALPTFFMSAAERRAREACEQDLPECRPAVRQQMRDEKAASLITPWLILGVMILGVLFVLRAKERAKTKHRQMAQRRHDPKAYKKLDQSKEDRDAETKARDEAF